MEQETKTTSMSITPSSRSIEQCAAFIGGVLGRAARGRQIMTISTAREVVMPRFAKQHDDSILIDDADHNLMYNSVLVALEMDGVLGVTLRSTAGAANPSARTEMRGWVVTPHSIRALTEEEIIEACCGTNANGETISPEPGVAYKAGWDIPTAVEK